MEKRKTAEVILVILEGLLFVELVLGICTIQYPFLDTIALIPLILGILYGLWLYRKPHGHMLKYAMLIFAIERIIESIGCIKQGWDVSYNQTAKIFASVIIVYIAGRLNRIEQNKYLFPIAFLLIFEGVLVAVITFATQYSLIYVISWFGEPILILTFMISYFVRYDEHKEAGLIDKAEN